MNSMRLTHRSQSTNFALSFRSNPESNDAASNVTELMRACARGEVDEIRRIVKADKVRGKLRDCVECWWKENTPTVSLQSQLSISDSNGRRPLHYAVSSGDTTAVQSILKDLEEDDVDAIDKYGRVPLSLKLTCRIIFCPGKRKYCFVLTGQKIIPKANIFWVLFWFCQSKK